MSKKNTTKKSFTPAYTVDMTWCETAGDLKAAIIIGKADHVIITEDELDFIIGKTMSDTIRYCELVPTMFEEFKKFINEIINSSCPLCTKKPWYKRFWNWLIGRK